MFYGVIAGITFLISALTILAQLLLLPVFFKQSAVITHDIEERMKLFKLLADLGSINIAENHRELLRRKKSLNNCPPPEPGPPGPPGDPGEDGEQGDDGPPGYPGKNELELLEEIEQQCIICPRGKRGPPGPPGAQGIQGPKGDRGAPGNSGADGVDGEMGLEGPEGYSGINGMRGPKGPNGKSTTGGIGKSGPKGLPGSIGRTGPQGPRGKRNYVYGPPGPVGKKGIKGMDGLPGNFGSRGNRGPVGEPGANAIFCPCSLEMKLLDAKQQRYLTEMKMMIKGKNENFDEISTSRSQPISSLSSIIDYNNMRKYSNENSNMKSKQQLIMPTNIAQYNNSKQLPQISTPSKEVDDDKMMSDNENDKGNDHSWKNEAEIQFNNTAKSTEYQQHRFKTKIIPTDSDQRKKDQIPDLIQNNVLYFKIEQRRGRQQQQRISEISKDNIYQSRHSNEDDEQSKIGKAQIERIKSATTMSTTITSVTTTIITTTATSITTSELLITGYPDETTHSVRSRFRYITKRPRSL